jgi:hypothetical protein
MHAIALWRLELGERMKVLDQLLGSTSIFATVVTQLKFRNIGFVGAGLIILWALSPIGGQASLRVLDFSTATTTQPQTMQYLDMNSTFEPADMGAIGEPDAESAIFTHRALRSIFIEPFVHQSFGHGYLGKCEDSYDRAPFEPNPGQRRLV